MGQALAIAALVGAGVGAGSAALTGGDPLKGALFGALGGALMPGAGGLLGGAEAGAAEGIAAGAGRGLLRNIAGKSPASVAANFIKPVPLLGDAFIGGPGTAIGEIGAAGAQNLAAQNVAKTAAKAAVPEVGLGELISPTVTKDLGGAQRWGHYLVQNPGQAGAIGGGLASMMMGGGSEMPGREPYTGALSKFNYDPYRYRTATLADGGIADSMRSELYPQAQIRASNYALPTQMPIGADVIRSEDVADGSITNLPVDQRYAVGGHLGSYSDGGRLLKGPGDGMSDSIPGQIGAKQPARLADGEFVVPADVVSHLGNGSTDAGAKQLYAMMDKVRSARTGNKQQGKQINARKMLPA